MNLNPSDILGGGGLLQTVFIVPTLVAAILILAAGRKEDDANRTQMRYVGAIGIVTLFIALWEFYKVVGHLSTYIIDNHGPGNPILRNATDALLLLLTAGAVFGYQKRRAMTLSPSNSFAKTGTGAAARAALYGVCFVAALIALVAAARTVYGILQLIMPGIYGPKGDTGQVRTAGIADFVTFGSLTVASVVIFLRSWNWLPEHRK
jgi:hypothetical protein